LTHNLRPAGQFSLLVMAVLRLGVLLGVVSTWRS